MTLSVFTACLGCFMVGYAIGLWFSQPIEYRTEVRLDKDVLDELNRMALEQEEDTGENGEEDGQKTTSDK